MMTTTNNTIDICKFRRDQVICRDTVVIFVADDVGARVCRIPPRRKRAYIPACHIADYGSYLFIPRDVIPTDANYYEWEKPVDAAYMEKWDWLETKRTHPYQGENYVKRIRDL